MNSLVEISDELASTLASIQELAGVSRRLDQIESSHQDSHLVGMVTDETVSHASQIAQALPPGVSLGTPFHLANHYETIPSPTVTVPPPLFLVLIILDWASRRPGLKGLSPG